MLRSCARCGTDVYALVHENQGYFDELSINSNHSRATRNAFGNVPARLRDVQRYSSSIPSLRSLRLRQMAHSLEVICR
jgi:hypothetical protein